MENPQDFQSLHDQIQKTLLSTTRTAGQVASEDLAFQRSLDPSVGTSIDQQSKRLLDLCRSLLKSAASISELDTPLLQDVDDVDNNWRSVVDVVDSLLEKADTCLDEYTGVIKPKTDSNTELPSSKSRKNHSLANSFRTQNIVKPQLAFLTKPKNADTTPWKPLLMSKPHAIVPLEKSLSTFSNELQQQQYKHPYEPEILELQYPDAIYHKSDPIPYLPVESTTASFVDTFEGVLEMLADLKRAKEIAVDLEHHDARSFIGLVSLMQISTRDKDWIVDTLKPWRQDLQVLNEVFADPRIIKVFHGAYMDIVWLQRDLGLYVTGLFDTHHASRVLGYPGGSLAYLLKRFIDFDADKKYQLADWRIRPLPDEMFFYARADTHYLLYIYDHLRNELLDSSDPTVVEGNRIELVLQKSKETSLLRFERQIYDAEKGQGPGGWYPLLAKTPALFTNQQLAVFRAVHAWRDRIARIDDDSTNFVMSNSVIFNLAKLMPVDMVSLYGTAHPISHNVKMRAAELLGIIKVAKVAGKDGPSMMDILRPDSVGAMTKTNGPSTRTARETGQAPVEAVFPSDQGLLRTEKSMFWGGTFGSSIWEPPSQFAAVITDLRLAVPLPQVTSKVFAESTVDMKDDHPLHDEQATENNAQNKTVGQISEGIEDDAFVIKSGRKRKAKDVVANSNDSPEVLTEYDISLNEEEELRTRENAAAKAEKKAQRKLEKAARKIANGGISDTPRAHNEEEEAFDYNKAESILYGKGKESSGSGGKRKKPFDPYSKSADAPKGMRRLQTERAGKSFTFKS